MLQPGDVLVLYTDGVTEASDATLEMYGLERFCATTKAHVGSPADQVKAAILDDVREFMGDAAQADDIALVILKRN